MGDLHGVFCVYNNFRFCRRSYRRSCGWPQRAFAAGAGVGRETVERARRRRHNGVTEGVDMFVHVDVCAVGDSFVIISEVNLCPLQLVAVIVNIAYAVAIAERGIANGFKACRQTHALECGAICKRGRTYSLHLVGNIDRLKARAALERSLIDSSQISRQRNILQCGAALKCGFIKAVRFRRQYNTFKTCAAFKSRAVNIPKVIRQCNICKADTVFENPIVYRTHAFRNCHTCQTCATAKRI